MESLFKPISSHYLKPESRNVVTPNQEDSINLNDNTSSTYIYPNGDIYIGPYAKGKYGIIRNGHGKLITPTRIYNGNFRDDQPQVLFLEILVSYDSYYHQGFGMLEILDYSDGIIQFTGFFNSDDKRIGCLVFHDGIYLLFFLK